jgi:hypothetical protein
MSGREWPHAYTCAACTVRLRASADKDKEEQEQEEEEAAAAVRVDADTVSRMLAKASFGRILAVGQTVAIPWEGGRTLLALVTAANNLEADEQADRVVYHCYRGLVTADTRVDVAAVANAGTAAGLELFNVRAPCIVGQSRTGHLVHITTCDGACTAAVVQSPCAGCSWMCKAASYTVSPTVGSNEPPTWAYIRTHEAIASARPLTDVIDQTAAALQCLRWADCCQVSPYCMGCPIQSTA